VGQTKKEEYRVKRELCVWLSLLSGALSCWFVGSEGQNKERAKKKRKSKEREEGKKILSVSNLPVETVALIFVVKCFR